MSFIYKYLVSFRFVLSFFLLCFAFAIKLEKVNSYNLNIEPFK